MRRLLFILIFVSYHAHAELSLYIFNSAYYVADNVSDYVVTCDYIDICQDEIVSRINQGRIRALNYPHWDYTFSPNGQWSGVYLAYDMLCVFNYYDPDKPNVVLTCGTLERYYPSDCYAAASATTNIILPSFFNRKPLSQLPYTQLCFTVGTLQCQANYSAAGIQLKPGEQTVYGYNYYDIYFNGSECQDHGDTLVDPQIRPLMNPDLTACEQDNSITLCAGGNDPTLPGSPAYNSGGGGINNPGGDSGGDVPIDISSIENAIKSAADRAHEDAQDLETNLHSWLDQHYQKTTQDLANYFQTLDGTVRESANAIINGLGNIKTGSENDGSAVAGKLDQLIEQTRPGQFGTATMPGFGFDDPIVPYEEAIAQYNQAITQIAAEVGLTVGGGGFSSGGALPNRTHNIYGVSVDFSLIRFSAFWNALGGLLIFASWFIAVGIIIGGDK